MPELNLYEDETALFDAVSERCVIQLEKALKKAPTTLVVPGGTTPQPLFERLSNADLDWKNVTVIPSDDRWLEADNPASNERLIRQYLLQNKAAVAEFKALKLDYPTPIEAVDRLQSQLMKFKRPHAVTVVGMGPDGHFASLFPNTPHIIRGLDPSVVKRCIGMDASGCPVAGNYTQRMSLTLSYLIYSDLVIVLFKGQDKLDLVHSILNGEQQNLPVAHLFRQSAKTPISICCMA